MTFGSEKQGISLQDIFNKQNWEIIFEAIEGDLSIFKGSWQIKGLKSPFTIIFTAEYSLGLPPLEKALGHILKEKINSNICQMIESINRRLSDER